MKNILVFGNSGSGKSTLARELCELHSLAHLDLDDLAWQATKPPRRRPLEESEGLIANFMRNNRTWVIEGCYTDLLQMAASSATEIIYMNLPVAACIANARKRPWEPHKYDSQQAQDANLDLLTSWISQYEHRDDTFSAAQHRHFFDDFPKKKTVYTSNERNS